MAEIIRQRVLRRASSQASRDGGDRHHLEAMLRYYAPLGAVHARGRAREATEA